MTTNEGSFVWYELDTRDVAAAGAFYSEVVGWDLLESGMPGYVLASVGTRQVAGLTNSSDDDDAPRGSWTGMILVDDVDQAAQKVRALGGALKGEPSEISGIGRFVVALDPQGAVFTLFQALGEPAAELANDTPGVIGWHELHTSDWEAAFEFYQGMFGWEKSFANDMGPAGVYQTFSVKGVWAGGMMSNSQVPFPAWLFYISVDDIDAAAVRLAGAGGVVLHGPHQVPGGNWVLMAKDPQGANFALSGSRTA